MTDLATRLYVRTRTKALGRTELLRRSEGSFRSERGDVPGWVLVTLMSALLVVALLAFAQGKLIEVFNRAMDAVTG